VLDTAPRDYPLAVEITRCQRLIKGYGDTHERGTRNFEAVMAGLQTLEARDDAAECVARLREAALADEQGGALDEALASLGVEQGEQVEQGVSR